VKQNIFQLVRKYIYTAFDFVTKEPSLIATISRKVITQQLSSVTSAEVKSWQPQIKKRQKGKN
jgi:hypothetical protein